MRSLIGFSVSMRRFSETHAWTRILLLVIPLAGPILSGGTARAQSVNNQHVSSGGAQANWYVDNDEAAVSENGRWVAFASSASNLVPGDTNGESDIFVHDNLTGSTVLISWDLSGGPSNGGNRRPSISADGRFVAFQSSSSDLTAGDVNGTADVFRHDRDTDADGIFDEPGATATILVSLGAGGVQGNGPSRCYATCISDDGDVISFESEATNLVAGDTNGFDDCFVREVGSGTTTRVSIGPGGVQAVGPCQEPDVSGDGNYVAYFSYAGNLVGGDTNGVEDIFVYNRTSGVTTRASVSTGGAQGNGSSIRPAISDDGSRVVFSSLASNLVAGDTNGQGDIFLRDLAAGTTTRVSVGPAGIQGNDFSLDLCTISGDGNVVAFASAATNLIAGDTNGFEDIFVRDLTLGVTVRASRAADGTQPNGRSVEPGLDATGTFVAFRSNATNLVAADTNGFDDVFLRGSPFLGPGGLGGGPAGWTAAVLHPAGATRSWAYATSDAEQGGFATFGPGAGLDHAGVWSGSAASWIDLNPAGATFSRAFTRGGAQEAGYADFPGIGTHAGVWTGTAASWTDLHPAAATASYAHATTGAAQAGYVEVGGSFHASLWTGTAASWVDLNPAAATSSYAWGRSAAQEVGGAVIGGNFHASLWTGAAASWVDLNPAGSAYSFCYYTTGAQQAGYADVGGAEHAGIWSGAAASWTDLHPAGALWSRAYGTTGTNQAGYVALPGGSVHAGIWSGGAATWLDLHAVLPPGYSDSYARWIADVGGSLYVSGFAWNTALAREEAVAWTNGAFTPPPPPPTAMEDLPVTFSVNGPVDPQTDGIRFARGTPPTPQVPLQPGNPVGACIRTGIVPQATGLATPWPGDVSDYDALGVPSEAVLFQSPPYPPALPGPPPTPPDGTNNQILESIAIGLVSGPAVPPPLWTTVPPGAYARDNVDALSFGEDYFPTTISVGLAADGLPPPPFGTDGEIEPAMTPWDLRPLGLLYSEPVVLTDVPGISFRFSVDPWATGAGGTSVSSESGGGDAGAACGPWTSGGDAAGDVFGTPVLMRVLGLTVGAAGNVLVHDNPTLALAPSPPPMSPMEDDLDALECVGDNTAPWFGGVALRPGNLHARVVEAGPPDPAAPGISAHDVRNMAPIFFSVTRSSTGEPFSAVRSQFVVDGGAAADIFVAVKNPADPAGDGFNLLFADESEIGLYALDASPGGTGYNDQTDDLDALILWVCPQYRYYVGQAIMEILGLVYPFTPGGFAPWIPYGGPGGAMTGGGMTISIIKYLASTGRYVPPGCIRVGFSITTDSIGLLYTGTDWEAGPVFPPGGVSSAAGDIFYAEPDGEAVNPNYLWYEETDLGLDAGSWVNGASTDLADLCDNLDALDSHFEQAGDPAGIGEPETPKTGFSIDPSQPNPFSSRTSISFQLAKAAQVQVTVYDLQGRAVKTLVNGTWPTGRHFAEWDGRDADGKRVAAGVYYLRVESEGAVQTGKAVLLKE